MQEKNLIVDSFADYNKNILIYASDWIEQDSINKNIVTIDEYLEEANTITYTFKLGSDNEYHYVRVK